MGKMSRLTESVLVAALGFLGFSSCNRTKTDVQSPNAKNVEKGRTGGKLRRADVPVCIYAGPSMIGSTRVIQPVDSLPADGKPVPVKQGPVNETTPVKPVTK